jgi:hypothetical protein
MDRARDMIGGVVRLLMLLLALVLGLLIWTAYFQHCGRHEGAPAEKWAES